MERNPARLCEVAPPPDLRTKATLGEEFSDLPDVPQPSLPFCYWSVFYGLASIFMNWNSLNKMVLWCFNVTVPDPVLLRCYQGSETTTNQKQGGLQSLLASPSPFWCCLLRPLFTVLKPALSSFSVLFYSSSLGGRTQKGRFRRQLAPSRDGSGPPGAAGALLTPLSSRAWWERKDEGFFFFLPLVSEEGESGTLAAPSNMAGILVVSSCSPGCQVGTPEGLRGTHIPRCSTWTSFLPWRCQATAGGGLVPLLLTALGPALLLPVSPRVPTEGRSFLCSLDATEAAF